MTQPIVEIPLTQWHANEADPAWVAALEAGKVLYFPQLAFKLLPQEEAFLTPSIRDPKSRNISLDGNGRIKGVAGDTATQLAMALMVGRYRSQALELVDTVLPQYKGKLRIAPTSFRPMQVETRPQSVRADDKRMHVDAFPSRPTYGERILRVFTNVNPDGVPRVWRVGEPFETIAERFLPGSRPYSRWQAQVMSALKITKSVRSEYDHLMNQLHDRMKADTAYQASPQTVMPFPPGSVWIAYADQAPHAVMSGQYMMEQTLHLQPADQYDPESSPLAILTRMTGHALI